MVSSMHNEADAEDYIVWHRISICIDYLFPELAAAVWVWMCTSLMNTPLFLTGVSALWKLVSE